ncbi:MAG: class I tRNA ligase family protein, partial [Candidatus Veblenbacteria bacterium]|nr:class I tRNA ligase family protein [Candidatus Veblenbacteria bacterium]
QWLFLQLYAKGLAYRKEAPVNWCPSCQTVLANEQVVNGECERCGSRVEQRQMKQWFFKTTAYAERLLKELEGLDWPAPIIEMQRNWIGRSEGASVKFTLTSVPGQEDKKHVVEVFTTRLDTIFGATFLVVSPELAQKWLDVGWQTTAEVKTYVAQAVKGRELERLERAAKEKTGVDTGVRAINPATGEEIPVWVADYVLGSYGSGAIMAVPAHDERDFAFAKKFGLPVQRVVEPKFVATTGEGALRPNQDVVKRNAVCAVVRNPKDGTYLCVSWRAFHMHGFVTGGVEEGEDIVKAALREIHEETGYKNIRLARNPEFALHSFFYHRVKQQNRHARFQYLFFELEDEARDPIDEKEDKLHEIVWKRPDELKDFFSVIEGQFIMNFLANPDYIHTGEGILANSGEFSGMDSTEAKVAIAKKIGAELTTQYRLRDWLVSRQRYWGAPIPIIYCETCGEVPVPEKDLPVQLPDDVDFRPTGESPLARSKMFHNVVCPKCGASARRESDTMDTFVDSSWYFLRYCDPQNNEVAFDKKKVAQWCPVSLYVGGAEHAVLHLMYARFITKALQDMGHLAFSEPFLKLRNQGLILGEDGQKMSKSRGNVINPDDIVQEYGADTLRLYEMFMGPLEEAKPWNTSSIVGMRRFLERVWNLCDRWKVNYDGRSKNDQAFYDSEVGDGRLTRFFHDTIKKVTDDIETMRYNTAISTLMSLLNKIQQFTKEGTTTTTITKRISLP